MVKYVESMVTFSEFPDEIALCINVSNCPCHCENCHSSYLANDIGKELTTDELKILIDKNSGISCVGFMGHGNLNGYRYINSTLVPFIRQNYPELKIGLYSGFETLPELFNGDFLKLGPYKKDCGPLTEITTNQRYYKIVDSNFINKTDLF